MKLTFWRGGGAADDSPPAPTRPLGRITTRFDLDGTGHLTEAQRRARDLVDEEGNALAAEVIAAMELSIEQETKVRSRIFCTLLGMPWLVLSSLSLWP